MPAQCGRHVRRWQVPPDHTEALLTLPGARARTAIAPVDYGLSSRPLGPLPCALGPRPYGVSAHAPPDSKMNTTPRVDRPRMNRITATTPSTVAATLSCLAVIGAPR